MDRRALWPDFRDAHVLYEDDALVAVNKPPGVPSMAADPQWPDDMPTRLRRHLAARDGVAPDRIYLGTHHRLDRATSGVLVYARSRAANPGLARQFEGRTVRKEYVACVRGGPGGERARVLRDHLARSKDHRTMRVVPRGRGRGRSKAKEAVTSVRVRERRGERAMLSCRIETGRTHQIRVQLAHAGWPVAGDDLYGGPPAPRLLLHASALSLEHPTSGAPLRLEAPVPPGFADWLDGHDEVDLGDRAALERALAVAAEARWALGRAGEAPEPTTAFRLLNGAGDGVPGLTADVYGDHVVAHAYGERACDTEDVWLDALSALGFDGVYLKRHPREASTLGDSRRRDVAPAGPVRGDAAPEELTVLENGVGYRVRLGDGLSTGLFLDQRDNRKRVRALAHGASVLNLFAYTCPFTVAAAAGGASRTVSVDASQPALERGERNLAALGAAGDHRFVHADVFETLESFVRRGERFDLVIVDPPTYSTTRASRWTSGTDWRWLAALAFGAVALGGAMLACSNDARLPRNKLRRYLHEAAREAGRDVRQMKDLPVGGDFPPPHGVEPHLASVLVRLEG